MASIIMQGRIHAPTRHRAIVRIRHSRTGSAFRHATAARRRLQGRLRASHGWTDAEGDNLVVVSMRSDDSKYEANDVARHRMNRLGLLATTRSCSRLL